ncbi:uncharacterized protein F5891DRAFT_984903 [Suillus fuscotomentosus]|uniref:ATP-citrate synthase citrate-binding domain-containing protein n=1 Tax=Suillus fuscotomentosus TaxID=1912939 RepID=A0AAD4DXF0_9AGAM|nr:uncharacterized protein F5891DRAFT_984903 [Suillus fuscotomentosus]KAG1894634.1 hypothetical protein F5891DRAFT_984903 [Suillus fuscotomentosus]
MAAKLDQTAEGICGPKRAVARDLIVYETAPATPTTGSKEEAYAQKLDASTGASLKLTVLNPNGRIWIMIADGAAGFAHELANYGEYSGAPNEGQAFEYAKTTFDLLTRPPPRPD